MFRQVHSLTCLDLHSVELQHLQHLSECLTNLRVLRLETHRWLLEHEEERVWLTQDIDSPRFVLPSAYLQDLFLKGNIAVDPAVFAGATPHLSGAAWRMHSGGRVLNSRLVVVVVCLRAPVCLRLWVGLQSSVLCV